MSVEHRRRVEREMKIEQRENIKLNNYTRLSVQEHTERVRFDPTRVEKNIPGNKYKLIYPPDPNSGGGVHQELYDKIQKKATAMWKAATGTETNTKVRKGLL